MAEKNFTFGSSETATGNEVGKGKKVAGPFLESLPRLLTWLSPGCWRREWRIKHTASYGPMGDPKPQHGPLFSWPIVNSESGTPNFHAGQSLSRSLALIHAVISHFEVEDDGAPGKRKRVGTRNRSPKTKANMKSDEVEDDGAEEEEAESDDESEADSGDDGSDESDDDETDADESGEGDDEDAEEDADADEEDEGEIRFR